MLLQKTHSKGEMIMEIVKIVDNLMAQGLDGESACREAYAVTHQHDFDEENYDPYISDRY